MKGFVVGSYFPGDSFVHRLDPRAKLGFVFVFMIYVFFADAVLPSGILFLFTLAAVRLAQIPFKLFFGALKPVFWIMLISLFLHLLMTKGGEPVLSLSFVTIYEEGIRQAGIIAIRLYLFVSIASLLTFTTAPMDLTDGIEKLLSPFKKVGVPAHELSLMMSIALRFIPTLWEETEKIRKAQMARGVNFEEGHLVERMKKYIPILIPLFVSSFRRAEELALAMEARCYRGAEGRTTWRELHFALKDLWLLITLILLGGVLWIFHQ